MDLASPSGSGSRDRAGAVVVEMGQVLPEVCTNCGEGVNAHLQREVDAKAGLAPPCRRQSRLRLKLFPKRWESNWNPPLRLPVKDTTWCGGT